MRDSSLQLLHPQVARMIAGCQDAIALKLFAIQCAKYALTACNIESEALITNALALAIKLNSSVPAGELEPIRQELGSRVEELDEQAFVVKELFEKKEAQWEQYIELFTRARAMSSLDNCLLLDPIKASVNACYEAYHATNHWEALILLAQEILPSTKGTS